MRKQQQCVGRTDDSSKGEAGMGRLIKVLVVLAVLGFIGLTGYAYLADLSPTASEVKLPVTLNVD